MNFPPWQTRLPSPYPNTTTISPRPHMTPRIETFPGPAEDTVAIISRTRAERKIDSTKKKACNVIMQNRRASYSGGASGKEKGVQVPNQ